MDQRTKELVAMGAAAAVNCRPCMEYHLPLCQDAGASPEDIGAAVEMGLQVGRGAAVKTREYVNALLSTEDVPAAQAAALGISVENSRVLLHRGRRALRRLFEANCRLSFGSDSILCERR